MMRIAADKASLRVEFGARRRALTQAELMQKQEQMVAQAANLSLPAHGVWMLFKPMVLHNEIEPLAVANAARHEEATPQYAYPFITSEGQMDARLVSCTTQWQQNEWGIPEPQNGVWVAPHFISVMFVPLLAFDMRGYRVGFGKGYYDRFIVRCTPGIVTVGLSYFDAVDEITNIMPFDIPMRYCVTPHKVYAF